MKRITQTDIIKSNDVNGDIVSENKLEYSVERDISEFSGNELPSLSAVQQLVDQVIPPTEIPRILPWTSSEVVAKDFYRSHIINVIEYLFRSTVDDNVSEPSFESTLGAWAKTDKFGPIFSWQSGSTYALKQWIELSATGEVFESKINGNNGNQPVTGGISNEFWDYIGLNVGDWYSGGFFQIKNIVTDATDSKRIYISNIENNEQPLSDHGAGPTWQVVGIIISDDEVSLTKTWSSQKISDAIAAGSSTSLTFNQSNLTEVYEGNYSLSFNLPDGKSIVSIERLQDGVISRIDTSMAITTPANNPNTRIEGFDNNSPQTITIKIN